jgi:membrane protease YdiL (CAAX protease family)
MQPLPTPQELSILNHERAFKMSETTHTTTRPLIARIFLSPVEKRLRAGWRLLLHTALLIAITLILFIALRFWDNFPMSEQLIAMIAITLATWIARRFLDRRSLPSLGFRFDRHTLPDLGLGMVLPALMMGLIYICEWAFGWLRFEAWAWNVVSWEEIYYNLISMLAAFIAVGYYEELLSRGYHLQNLKDGLNLPWAVFLSSSVFAVLHLGNPHAGWLSTLGILAAGYFLAYGWIRTGQLWLPIGLHIGWDFFEGPIFGFPVSGLNTFRLIHHNIHGPTMITGGDFGPEAGLILVPALLLGAFLIRLYTRHRNQPSTP